MATRFSEVIKKCLMKLKSLHSHKEKPLALAPLEALPNTQVHSKITKNVYAETVDPLSDKTQVMMVEVESFQNEDLHVADLSMSLKVKVTNYTREGDDPNLRITHYPPSNRLH